jgi:6-phosphofructokinase 1
MAIKRIGVITSGGDCGGLNAVIKGTAGMAAANGIETVVIPNGYAGLYNLVEFNSLVTLNEARADLIDANLAGSEAGHSRVKIKKIKDENKYQRIKDGLTKHGIDALVISGGDDTGSVIVDLASQGIPCVHAPKTMDLDLQPYSVGGDSAVNRTATLVAELKTTANSHNRVMVFEVFGRYVGHTALRGGVAAEADAILIPEIPVDFDSLYKHMKKVYCRRVETSDVKAGTYIIVASEGIKSAEGEHITDDSAGVDAFGHKKLAGAGKYIRTELEARMKKDPEMKEFMKRVGSFIEGVLELPEIREVQPGHIVRSGHSSAIDVNFGKQAGAAAVSLLMAGMSGVTVVDNEGGKIRYMKTADAIKQRFVDLNTVAMYETLGICFGRAPQAYSPQISEVSGTPDRAM